MLIENLGYIFECRSDCKNNIGVMESYKVLFRDNAQNVTITCAIDTTGKIITPAYNDLSLGFKPLTNNCKDAADVERFMKSNKPFFGKLGEFAMIASGTIVYDKVTGELLSTKDLKFYVPKTVSTSVLDGEIPALVCDMVGTSKGLNVFEIGEPIYNGYVQSFLSCLSQEITSTKLNYLSYLILKEA